MADYPYTKMHFEPIADPAAIVRQGHARFTVLTSRLIRLEHSLDDIFEDRPSQAFWYRRQPVPVFDVERTGDRLTLRTPHLSVEYRPDDRGFSRDNLIITLLPGGRTWRPGDPDSGNLGGTTRTLDTVEGSIRLEPGLLSRDGWVLVDDSASLVFNESGWLEPRGLTAGGQDLYFFGYGQDYRGCLLDYRRVSGPASLLPRWALGNWWSRYWSYRDQELRQLMSDFRRHEVPLSVCIIDMDWHLVDVGQGINGWTGYTWNKDLFPNPADFIAWLHEQGLKTALNLHPALGVRPHESMYSEMAARMAIDPATGATIPFDIADPRFTAAYFEVLHHPLEDMGIDFWWMDWQQGTRTKVSGLDPLWWLNHLHYYDLGRANKRPFIFSRWGGLGNHRYPIGFSGDTVVSWASLAFQPYFTATAANVGYGWWSHDIGGHMHGLEDAELFTRWVQFGVFSPILRLHSTNNPYHERRPWGYDAETFRVTREAMQLRHALIPYLYTMSRLDETQGQTLVRPMYHDFPDQAEAYACPQQYMFGTSLIAAPYTEPAHPQTRLARQVFWLPSGDWFHFLTGEYFQGDAWHVRYGGLDDMPVFARAGSVIPLGPRVGWGGVENPDVLDIYLFAGADGRFVLYEDDGETNEYRQGVFAQTVVAQRWEVDSDTPTVRISIAPVTGQAGVLPEKRRYRFHLVGVTEPERLTARIDGGVSKIASVYDGACKTLRFDELMLEPNAGLQIVASFKNASVPLRSDTTRQRLEAMLAAFRMDTHAKYLLVSRLSELIESPLMLADFGQELTPVQLQALLEVSQDVGHHHLRDLAHPHQLVLWNNRAKSGFSYFFTESDPTRRNPADRFRSSLGSVPRFETIAPAKSRWKLSLDYFGILNQVIESKGVSGD